MASVSRILAHWRILYGVIFVCAAAVVLVTLVLNLHEITHKARGAFGFEWAFWSRKANLLAPGMVPFVGLWILLTLVERRFPAGTVKPATAWLLNLKISLLTFFYGPLLAALVGVLLGHISRWIGIGFIDLRLAQGASVGKAIVVYLIWFFTIDFFFYWYHRFQHESFLWQQHKVHHLDEQFSAITAQRGSWIEDLFYLPMVLVPSALLFKFDPATGGITFGVISLFVAVWQTFFHANLKIGFGWASPLFVSPQLHRIHHSQLPQHHDKNYAGFFPILDVLFGTYYHPKHDEYPPSGVLGEKDVRTLGAALVLPLRGWWKMYRGWRGRYSSS